MTSPSSHTQISIIVATYNRRSVLSRCLESILSQTYENFEIIVVDDGSTDGTKELVKDRFTRPPIRKSQQEANNTDSPSDPNNQIFKTSEGLVGGFTDSRIRYRELPSNQGASQARNRGIESAQGELILVWDSDDELYPYALQTVIDTFALHPEAGIVSAPAQPVSGEKEIPYKHVLEGFISLSEILCKKLPNNEKVRVARRECFEGVRYQSRNLDFMVNGWLAQKGKWYHIDVPLGTLYVERTDSLTAQRKKQNISLSIERATYLVGYLHEFGSLIHTACKTRYAALAYGASIGLLLAGKIADARVWASAARENDPRFFRHRLIALLSRIPYGTVVLRFLFRIMAL